LNEVFGEKVTNSHYCYRKGVYAVTLLEGKVMTVLNSHGHYFLPGGGVEVGESNLDCLAREVLEETGYTLEKAKYIGNASNYFTSLKNNPIHNDGYFYLTSIGECVQNPMETEYSMEGVDVKKSLSLLIHAHHVWAVKKAALKNL